MTSRPIVFPEPLVPGITVRRPVLAAQWGQIFTAIMCLAWLTTVALDFRTVLSAVTLVAFGAAMIGIWHPIIGLYGLGILCCLDAMVAPLLLHGGLLRWNSVNYLLLGVVFLYLPLMLRRREPQTIVLVMLLVWLAAGLAWSTDLSNGAQHMFGAAVYFGFLLYLLRATRYPKAWYWLGVVNGVTAAAASLAYLAQRAELPLVNPNVWSYVPVTGVLSVCVALAAAPVGARRFAVLVALGAANFSMAFLSGSRGSLLIVVVAMASVAFMSSSLKRGTLLVMLGLVLGTGLITQFPALEERTMGRVRLLFDQRVEVRTRTSGRSELARGAWVIFREHPMGVGTGSFPTYWATLGPRPGISRFRRGRPFSAHSAWLKTLAENGVVGTVLLTGFVMSFGLAGLRRRVRRRRVLGIMTSAILAVAFLSTEFQSKPVWFLAAASAALLKPGLGPRPRNQPP